MVHVLILEFKCLNNAFRVTYLEIQNDTFSATNNNNNSATTSPSADETRLRINCSSKLNLLISNLPDLQVLDIAYSGLNEVQLLPIIQSLSALSNFLELHARGNKIGAQFLTLLGHLKHLQYLDLYECKFGKDNVLFLMQSLHDLNFVKHLDIGWNGIGLSLIHI